MISDTLFEASSEIKIYLHDHPEAYEPWRDRITNLVTEMDAIRVELDTPRKQRDQEPAA